jgi:hypothetical protein
MTAACVCPYQGKGDLRFCALLKEQSSTIQTKLNDARSHHLQALTSLCRCIEALNTQSPDYGGHKYTLLEEEDAERSMQQRPGAQEVCVELRSITKYTILRVYQD